MVEADWSSNITASKFAFNGQQKDDEIYGQGNTYSAQYWEYDARLGRRWNLDPVDQISISNYATFANSPISLIDPNGAKWKDPASEAAGNESKKNASDKKSNLETERNKLTKSDVDAKGQAIYNKQELEQYNDLTTRIGYLDTYITKIDKMGDPNNPQEYMMNISNKTYGYAEYNPTDGSIVINYLQKDEGNRIHEVIHGYQIGVEKSLNRNRSNYSHKHEVEAYNYQAAYNGIISFYIYGIVANKNGKIGIVNSNELYKAGKINASVIHFMMEGQESYKYVYPMFHFWDNPGNLNIINQINENINNTGLTGLEK